MGAWFPPVVVAKGHHAPHSARTPRPPAGGSGAASAAARRAETAVPLTGRRTLPSTAGPPVDVRSPGPIMVRGFVPARAWSRLSGSNRRPSLYKSIKGD
ncbi:hypothetical protein GCM10010420_07250 [Streptomyces glaucosporus]|uniref:Uncharacterized protein n=1 Tax=Streptomyces glaucosporus TaxID=284044 RepID=A0ABN3HS36_9ACTN